MLGPYIADSITTKRIDAILEIGKFLVVNAQRAISGGGEGQQLMSSIFN